MVEEKSGFHFERLEGELVEKLIESCETMYKGGIVRITPSNCCLPYEYNEHAERIRQLKVYPDDVWIITYPKSGTTWIQEMVWLLMNNLDFKTAKTVMQSKRSPFLEFGCIGRNDGLHDMDSVKEVEELERPRCIKSHLPLHLLPREILTVKPKVVYVARGAKDTAVSYYHHHRLLTGFSGTCEEFVEAFVAGIVGWGCIWDHILEFWKIRHEPYILFNTYEEMKKDLPGVVMRTAKFLNRDLSSEQLEQLCEHLSFESMKNNPMVSLHHLLYQSKKYNVKGEVQPFIRKGKVGGWKGDLSPESAEKIDKWSKDKVKGTDYPLSC